MTSKEDHIDVLMGGNFGQRHGLEVEIGFRA
jgi:hypothetical protein